MYTDSMLAAKEIEEIQKQLLLNPEFIKNYSLEILEGSTSSFLGRGREGIVYLARDMTSGKLMAIKVKCEKSPDIHPYDGKKEVEAVKLFENVTKYQFEAKDHIEFNAKSFIKGDSLEKLMKSNQIFDASEQSNQKLRKLRELFELLIKGKLFFTDISPENLIYDGKKFYIVDLRPFDQYDTEEATRKSYSIQIFSSEIAWIQSRWYKPGHEQDGKNILLNFMSFIFL